MNKPCEINSPKPGMPLQRTFSQDIVVPKSLKESLDKQELFLEMLTRSLKKGPSHKTDNKDILDLANCFHARNAVRTSQAVDTDPFEELTRSLYKDMFKGAL